MERTSSRAVLLVAALTLVLVDRLVPYGRLVLYPFTLLTTWVHEMGHGLTAILVGGRFSHLEIFADASGVAHSSHAEGTASALVALGGLLAPPLTGALLLAFARGPRRAKLGLVLLGLGLLASCALLVRSTVGLVAMPLVAALLLFVARYGDGREGLFLVQLVALSFALDTLGRGLSYLFMDSVLIEGHEMTSDIGAVAQGLGGPRLLYSLLVAGLSLVLVLVGLWSGFRGEQARDPGRS
jgi:hypothetical protein